MKKLFFFLIVLQISFINIGISQVRDGVYYIRLANNNIMEAEGNTFNNNGCKIQIWQKVNNVQNQLWQFKRTATGSFVVKNLGSGKCLDVHAPDVSKNGGKVQLWDESPGNRNQEWLFRAVGGGGYTIRCAGSAGYKVLDVTGYNVGVFGTPIQIWDYATTNTANQIWYLDKVGDAPATGLSAKMTRFNPATHGFKFSNTFSIVPNIAGFDGPKLSGYCAGMAYSALDYFNAGIVIPNQNFRPLRGSRLYEFILNRQIHANVSNADKWAELVVNPFGERTKEFFRWGLQGFNGGRIQELKLFIDNGKPVPIGLFKAGNGGTGPHHEVLAIGYDMGRYKGDLGQYQEDFKIFVYDPNFPNTIMTLMANPAATSYSYKEDPACAWMTYFVDKKCNPSTPPRITTPVLQNDGMVRILKMELLTGGDDLRGDNDNVHAIVKYKDGSSDTYENINLRQKWINNYLETVTLNLKKPARLNQIHSVTLKTTFGGLNNDNWNLDALTILAVEGANERLVYHRSGTPMVRFDGNNSPLEAAFRY